ncbi:MAG: hypothetical protein U0165_02185 [Polyangiaceae bacterium]
MVLRSSVRRLTVLGAVLSAIALVSPAGAVIIQIDGTVVPQSNRIDEGLAKGENGLGSSNPANYTNNGAVPTDATGTVRRQGPINAVLDAAETPQVFTVPKSTGGQFGTVTFIDLLEGAGFENTFGWYNVGDDLTGPSKPSPGAHLLQHELRAHGQRRRKPIASRRRLRGPAQRVFVGSRDDPGTTIGYKGGFIGFFLGDS